MSLDPIDYDVVELRELARRRGDRYVEDGFLWPEPSEEFPALGDLAEVDHPETWTGSHEERQKPYLDEVPDSRAAASLVDRWIERLVEQAGFEGAVDALAYYRAMGWITESVEAALQDYLLAAGNNPEGSLADMDRDAHVDSLARIIALAQMGGRSGDGDDSGADAGEHPGAGAGEDQGGAAGEDPRADAGDGPAEPGAAE